MRMFYIYARKKKFDYSKIQVGFVRGVLYSLSDRKR